MSVFPSRDHSSALEAPKQLELGRAPQHGTTAARDVPSAACGRDGGVWGTFGALELGGAGARVKCCVMADSATAAAVGFLSSLQAPARLHRARQNGFKLCGVGALKLQVLPGLRLSAHHA